MDRKDEILSTNGSENELDPGVQALADLANKMNGDNSEPEYNESGFNSEGFHKNGTRYDDEGYGADGFNDIGVDREGFNYFGYDGDGYNRRGFDRKGFNRDGCNRAGFYRNRIHRETGTEYDPDGYNIYGLDENRFDRDGFYHRPGKGRTKTKYHKGYDSKGFDRRGFDREGFNRYGVDAEGYDRAGLDENGYTREYNAKFNKYGVDENGYCKNGEIDPDVEFAIDFAESGIKDQNKYAAEKGMNEEDVRKRIELARKKCPNIDEIIKSVLLTGNKMRFAAISNDCEKFIGGSLDVYGFWDKHPRLTTSDVLVSFINDPNKKKVFSDKTIEGIVMDSDNIENNLRIFGTSQYDISGAIKGVEDFKKIYARFSVDGSPEQIQQKRENMKKIYDIIKYFSRYKNRNLDSLLGFRWSFDGGQTWIECDGEAIGQAMNALKKDKKLICVQSVKDYVVNQSKNQNNNS